MNSIKRIRVLPLVLLFSSLAAHAESAKGNFFDFLIHPRLAGGYGTYKMGSMDEGSFSNLAVGFNAAVKVGPLLLGGDYMGGKVLNRSGKKTMSAADLASHPDFEDADQLSVGWKLGVLRDRWLIWYGYYGYDKLKKDITVSGTTYRFDYTGTAQSLEINYRVGSLYYIGVYGRTQKFDKYSTKHPTAPLNNEALYPALRGVDFGISFGLAGLISNL